MPSPIEVEQEDGRRLAENPELLGVLAYDSTLAEAVARVQALDCASWRIEWETVSRFRTA